MAQESWKIRFENCYPVDEAVEERLKRICENIDQIPESAIRVDVKEGTIIIDYSQVWDRFEAMRDLLRTVRAGERLVVKPPWDSVELRSDDIVIEIDPGDSFGSGLHETTRLCLRAIEKYLKPEDTVIDFGTGSGVLAIASAKLGADSVTATEADPKAVQTACSNVKRNHVDNLVEVVLADDLAVMQIEVDLISANVVPEIISGMKDEFRRLLKAGGLLICSGLTERNAQEIEAELTSSGFDIVEKLTEGHWVAFTAAKKQER
jgi:ribosomal protein L11 methyltransferase